MKELDLSAGGFPERTYVGKNTTVADVVEYIGKLKRLVDQETRAANFYFKEANEAHNRSVRLEGRLADLEEERDTFHEHP